MRAAAFFLLLCLAGCVPKPQLIHVPDGFTQPDIEQTARLTSLLAQSRARCAGYRSSAKVTLTKGVSSEQFRQITAFLRPSRLRIDFFDPTGTALLGLVVLDADAFWFLDKENKRVVTGEPSLENLERLTALPLAGGELMDWLCAVVPDFKVLEQAYIDTGSGSFIVDVRLPGSRMFRAAARIVGSPAYARIDRSSLSTIGGKVLLHTSYEYLGEERLPSVATSEVAAESLQLELEFQNQELNPQFSERALRAFSFTAPAGYVIEELR